MNKTTIDWPGLTHTWNPVTGCKNGCAYCYAARIAKRFNKSFEPQFHPNRLTDPEKEKEPCSIFVGSMTDLFGDFIPLDWTRKVLSACHKTPRHTFWFLTKNPENYFKFIAHFACIPNLKLGATITGSPDVRGREEQRIHAMEELGSRFSGINGTEIFLSAEPLLGAIPKLHTDGIKLIIAGPMTGAGAIPCKPEWMAFARDAAVEYGATFYKKKTFQTGGAA